MEDILFYIMIFCVIALFAFYFYWRYRRDKKIRVRIAAEYGKAPVWTLDERDYTSMKQYYELFPLAEPTIDDITWNDLNMDALFKRMKNTQSSIGDEYSYRFFRRQHNGDLPYFEKAV